MPPISQAVAQVYRDVFHCISELRVLALIVLLITLAFQTAEALLLPPGSGETSRDLLLRFVSNLAQGFLTVPVLYCGASAGHSRRAGDVLRIRAVKPAFPAFLLVVGDAQRRDVRADLAGRNPRASAWSGGIFLSRCTRRDADHPGRGHHRHVAPHHHLSRGRGGRAGCDWRNVMADTKGYAWRIFLFGLLAMSAACRAALVSGRVRNRDWIVDRQRTFDHRYRHVERRRTDAVHRRRVPPLPVDRQSHEAALTQRKHAKHSVKSHQGIAARVHDKSRNTFSIPPHVAPPRYQAWMTGADTIERKILGGPRCEECGGPTRILRIEPHKRFKRRHVWMLECLSCGAAQDAIMPAPQSTH